MELIKNLEEYGLGPKEAAIYLAVLELGKASISEIAQKGGIKRTIIYHYIDGLVSSGIIYKTVHGKRILYGASEPGKLVSSLEEKRRNIEKLLPELKALYESSFQKPSIKFYEGKNGIRSIYEEIFNTPYNVYALFSPKDFIKVFSHEENQKILEDLKMRGGQIFELIEDSDMAREFINQNYRRNISRVKFLPKEFKFSTDILATSEKIALISFDNLTGTIIENSAIAETQMALLKFIWKSL